MAACLVAQFETMTVFKLILTRFFQKLGPSLLWFVLVPIGVVVLFNVLMWITAYVECLTLDKSAYWDRMPGPNKPICR
jgi:hypothetical protein